MKNKYKILYRIIVMMLSYTERVMTMFTIRYVHGHVQVYDFRGKFMFSADSEQEEREELEAYAKCEA